MLRLSTRKEVCKMYEVYADSHLLYSSKIDNLKIFSPKVTLEVNKTGSFNFTIYPEHPYYNLIYKLKSIITVYQDDFLLFRGRVLNDELGFHNEKKIDCEGHLAFLLDSVVRPYSHTGSIVEFLTMLIDNHNSQVDAEKKFALGNVTVTDPNDYITRSSIECNNTWDVINEKLIKMLGGYISVRAEDGVYYIDYLEDFTLLAPQKVEFAKNLLDMKRIRKGETIKTALIPYGAKLKDAEGNDTDKRLTIADVNGGLDYIYDEEAVAEYGWIWDDYTWDDVTVASNLLTKGKARLASLIASDDTLELSAADLATIDKTVTSFHLGTYVQVTSNPHGIDQRFLVSKLSISLLNPASNKLTLGGVIESFTEQQKNNFTNINVSVAKGEKGEPGASSYMYVRYSANADGSNMTEEPQDNTAYIGVTTTTSSTAPTEVSAYSWTKIKGEDGSNGQDGADGQDGKDGSDGATGKGISNITEYYLASPLSSGVTTSTSGWSTSVPTITATNKYLWNYEVITYTDNTKLTIQPVIIGAYGDAGAKGTDGKGIASTTITYQASTSGTTVPTGTWSATIPTVSANQYLWTKTVITYTDNTTSTAYSIGKMGADGSNGQNGSDGKGISSTVITYQASASGTTVPTGTWGSSIPAVSASQYLWTRTVITYTDNTTSTAYSIGMMGATGATGATGNGINKITEYYLASESASGVTTSTSGWTTAIQTITSAKKYLWNYETITYTNGTSANTTPVIIGVYGDKGDTGAAGKDAAIQSATAPSDTSYMWLDTSSEPPILKSYNGTEWGVVNDNTEALQILEENLQSSIQESSTSLLLTVSENYYLKDETDALVSSVSTELEQTKDSFNMTFTQYSADLDALAAGTDAEFEEIKKYIRFSDGKILLGEVGNELELQIANDRISFLQNNVEVAYFTNRKLYVTDGEYTNSLTLGQFAFIPRTNGNLSFKKM